MTKHTYTEEDDKVIKEFVKASPTNLTEAFKKAAAKLNISPAAVRCHYYSTIQKQKDDKVFLTISSRKAANNYKVTRKGKSATRYQPEKTKKSKWKRILAILAE